MKKLLSSISITAVTTFVLTSFLGPSGWYWEWRKTTTEYEKYELDKITTIRDLQKEILDNVLKITALYSKRYSLSEEKDKTKADQIRGELHRQWKFEFPIIKDNINSLELILAKLENRSPRPFDFDPPPPPITSLTVSPATP